MIPNLDPELVADLQRLQVLMSVAGFSFIDKGAVVWVKA